MRVSCRISFIKIHFSLNFRNEAEVNTTQALTQFQTFQVSYEAATSILLPVAAKAERFGELH